MAYKNLNIKKQDTEILEIVQSIANGASIDKPVFIKLARMMAQDKNNKCYKEVISGSLHLKNEDNTESESKNMTRLTDIRENEYKLGNCSITNEMMEKISVFESIYEIERNCGNGNFIGEDCSCIGLNMMVSLNQMDNNLNEECVDKDDASKSSNEEMVIDERDNEDTLLYIADDGQDIGLDLTDNCGYNINGDHEDLLSEQFREIKYENKDEFGSEDDLRVLPSNVVPIMSFSEDTYKGQKSLKMSGLVNEFEDKVKTNDNKYKPRSRKLVDRTRTKTLITHLEKQSVKNKKDEELDYLQKSQNSCQITVNVVRNTKRIQISPEKVPEFEESIDIIEKQDDIFENESKLDIINKRLRTEIDEYSIMSEIQNEETNKKIQMKLETNKFEPETINETINEILNEQNCRSPVGTHGEIKTNNSNYEMKFDNNVGYKETNYYDNVSEKSMNINSSKDKITMDQKDYKIINKADRKEETSSISGNDDKINTNHKKVKILLNEKRDLVPNIEKDEDNTKKICIQKTSPLKITNNKEHKPAGLKGNIDVDIRTLRITDDLQRLNKKTKQITSSKILLDIDKLDGKVRSRFRKYCNQFILKSYLSDNSVNGDSSSSLWDLFYNFISCLSLIPYRDPFHESNIHDRKISPQIFDLGNYLLENGSKTNGIFRCSSLLEYSQEYPFQIHIGNVYEYKDHDIIDNAVVFKAYIREVLKGLIPYETARKILALYKEARVLFTADPEKGKTFKDKVTELIQKYLCFTLYTEFHDLLRLVFKLFREVDKNKQQTEIDIKGLSIIFAANIFPYDTFEDPNDYKIVPEIIELLYYADIDNVDIDVYRVFSAYAE